MNCPNCNTTLRPIVYESIELESCDSCGGEWLDHDEVHKVTIIRDARFSEDEKRAIVESTTHRGVHLPDADRNLTCPKCGGTTDPINYAGSTGIILDRCTSCRGFWLDAHELEKVQILVEGWDDALPADLKQHGARLRDIEAEVDRNDDVTVSRIPVVGRFINACVNGILDL